MNKKFTPPAVGGTSLFVIFSVLCLTVFTLLTVSTVRAGQRLGDSTQRAVTDYYAADCAAEEILASLRDGEIPEGVLENNGVYSYVCPVSDTRVLAVEVRVEGDNYEILRWQTISTARWEADDSLKVWDGGNS